MVFLPARRDPAAWVLGEKVRVLRQRLNRMLNQPVMEAGIFGCFAAGGAWFGFVITDLARGYCAGVERDDAILLRNAIGGTFG